MQERVHTGNKPGTLWEGLSLDVCALPVEVWGLDAVHFLNMHKQVSNQPADLNCWLQNINF